MTRFVPQQALNLITRNKSTVDERSVVHRVVYKSLVCILYQGLVQIGQRFWCQNIKPFITVLVFIIFGHEAECVAELPRLFWFVEPFRVHFVPGSRPNKTVLQRLNVLYVFKRTRKHGVAFGLASRQRRRSAHMLRDLYTF